MTKNPFINALLSVLYISLVSLIFYFLSTSKIEENSIVAPIAFISLFTFSVAMMSYLFFYQPFVLYFNGKKKVALDFFLKTLFTFGGIVIFIFILLFFGVFGQQI
jgi:hypothetical protein